MYLLFASKVYEPLGMKLHNLLQQPNLSQTPPEKIDIFSNLSSSHQLLMKDHKLFIVKVVCDYKAL